MNSRQARRRRRPSGRALAALGIALVVLSLTAVGLTRTRLDTSPASFLPTDATARATDELAQAFGGDPVVVLLETERPGQLTTAEQLPTLLALEGRLARLPDVAAVYGPATVLNQITGRTQDLLAQLVGYRDGLYASAVSAARGHGASEAAARIAGDTATAGFDARYAPLLVGGLPAGLPTLRNDGFVQSLAYGESGEPRPRWRFVLPRADAAAILVRPRPGLDQTTADQLVHRVRAAVDTHGPQVRRVTVSGSPVVAAALGGTLRAELPLLGAGALLAVALVFLLVRWTTRRHRLLPLLSTALATAVTLALFGLWGRPLTLPVIAVLPILLGVGSDFMTYLERRASRRLVVTVGLATSAAFGALAVTPVRAIQDLGLALAVGTALAVVTALLLRSWLGGTPARRSPSPVETTQPASRRPASRLVAASAIVVLALGWAALPRLPIRSDLAGFAEGSSATADAAHVEQTLGSSGELAVVVSGTDTLTPGALEWMTRTRTQLITAFGDQLRPVISPPALLGYLGPTPTPGQLDAALRMLPPYLTGSVVTSDHRLAVLLFATRIDDAQRLRELTDEVRATLPVPPPGLDVRLAGLPVAAASAYRAVSDSRYLANAVGLLAAGAVLLIGLRRRADAGRAVVAAALAGAVGYLALWITGTALTPLTAALGALTAAVGCEFTVVLGEATRRADPGLRRAVALAAAASATGYAVLGFSELAVVRQFGLLLAGSVALAYLAAELVVRLLPPPPSSSGDQGSKPSAVRPTTSKTASEFGGCRLPVRTSR